MAYTRSWDETFPPDTQNANQLGADVRNFKQDVRERIVSFASGLLADRPTPEAIWGSANDGILYFALDTKQVFRWNGTSWVDVTSSITSGNVLRDVTLQTKTNTDGDLNSITIPANSLVVGSMADFYGRVDFATSNLQTSKISIAGNTLGPVAGTQAGGGILSFWFYGIIMVISSSVSYVSVSIFSGPNPTNVVMGAPLTTVVGSLNIDWTSSQVLKTTVAGNGASTTKGVGLGIRINK